MDPLSEEVVGAVEDALAWTDDVPRLFPKAAKGEEL